MKTAIILGAGASQPYNFPLGPELKGIVTHFAAEHSAQGFLDQLGYERAHLQDLTECLRYGRFETIDEFLDAKKSFREIGGYIIAQAILRSETNSSLFPARDWLATLFAKIYKKVLAKEDLNISFITLNYDRTLEYFFSKITKYDCREDEEKEVATALSRIPILHPHGSLGSLTELPYGLNGEPSEAIKIQGAGKRIQIISDKLEDSPAYIEAQRELEGVDRILFMGFAYHPSTMGTLLKNIDPEKTELIGSSFNLSKERANSVIAWSKSTIKLQGVGANSFITDNII